MNGTQDIQKCQCGRCGYIIGMTDRDHLSVKTDNVFIYFYGGMAVISCKLCNTFNLIVDDEYEKRDQEKVRQAEKMLNSCRAVFTRWIPSREHRDRSAG